MSTETTYSEKIGAWRRFLAIAEANSADLPHLDLPRAKLETILQQAVAVNTDQGSRRAAKQEASKQLQQLVSEGQRLLSFMRQGVKEHYGVSSEKLSEFGLQPFRGQKRKSAEPKVPDPNAPTPAPEVHGTQH